MEQRGSQLQNQKISAQTKQRGLYSISLCFIVPLKQCSKNVITTHRKGGRSGFNESPSVCLLWYSAHFDYLHVHLNVLRSSKMLIFERYITPQWGPCSSSHLVQSSGSCLLRGLFSSWSTIPLADYVLFSVVRWCVPLLHRFSRQGQKMTGLYVC